MAAWYIRPRPSCPWPRSPPRTRPSSVARWWARCCSGCDGSQQIWAQKIWPERGEAHAAAQPPVGVVGGIGQVAARRQHHDHLLGDRLELGAEMAGALETEDFLLCGLDAQMPERRLIQGLHALARHHHADAADG